MFDPANPGLGFQPQTLDIGGASLGAFNAAAVASSGGLNMFNQGISSTLVHGWFYLNAQSQWTWAFEPLDSPKSLGAYNVAVVNASGDYQIFNQGIVNGAYVMRHAYWTGSIWAFDEPSLDPGNSSGAYIASTWLTAEACRS